MAISGIPFWMSQANNEYGGNGWAQDILNRAHIPAPRWLSNLAGTSNIHEFELPAGTYGTENFVSRFGLQNGYHYRIWIRGGVRMVANSTGEPAIYCEMAKGQGTSVQIIAQGGALIFGRGGNGGISIGGNHPSAQNGGAGGPACRFTAGVVDFQNQGADVRGGGGGGGSGGPSVNQTGLSPVAPGCGGGGRAYGLAGGGAETRKSSNATFDSVGSGGLGGSMTGGGRDTRVTHRAGDGGSGGDFGQPGNAGAWGSQDNPRPGYSAAPGQGGPAGPAIQWT